LRIGDELGDARSTPADDALLAEGYTVHACTGAGGRPRRFPAELLALRRRP